MRRYETIFIVDSDISEDKRKNVYNRTKEIVDNYKGFIADFDEWGLKKFAYEIRKKTRGFYVCMNYCGDGSMVTELERSFRLDESVLKFMTILLNGKTTIEEVKAELAKVEEDAAKKEEEKAAAAAEIASKKSEEVAKTEAPAETAETETEKTVEEE